jgi:dihydroorotase
MKTLLKNATLLDPTSPFHSTIQDVLISESTIVAIAPHIKEDEAQIIKHKNLHVSPGWFDPSVSFGEPGFEERETIYNGLNVAAKSGFTKVVLNPDTLPAVDSHSSVSHLLKTAAGSTTSLFPMGTITMGADGSQMASLYDMHIAGAVAFGDHKRSIISGNLLKIILQYAQSFEGLVLSHPINDELSLKGMMHEGPTSTKIGLKGIPSLGESLQISRDIQILEYAGGRLHIPFVSSESGVELIRQAKKKGLDLTCSVGLPNLFFDDTKLEGFDTNFKVYPPIRSRSDQSALKEGLLDGTIDMVSSMHEPMNIEFKKLEFELAMAGTIGLESSFGALCTIFPLQKALHFLTKGSERFGIKVSKIKTGEKADLTFFNPYINQIFEEKNILSTSTNSAFIGSQLSGKVIGSYNNGKLTLNS